MAKMWKKQQQDDENEQEEEEDDEEGQQVPQGKEALENSEPEEQGPVTSREQPENKNADHDDDESSSSSDSESDGGDREDDKDKTEETKADTENHWPGVVELNTLFVSVSFCLSLFFCNKIKVWTKCANHLLLFNMAPPKPIVAYIVVEESEGITFQTFAQLSCY